MWCFWLPCSVRCILVVFFFCIFPSRLPHANALATASFSLRELGTWANTLPQITGPAMPWSIMVSRATLAQARPSSSPWLASSSICQECLSGICRSLLTSCSFRDDFSHDPLLTLSVGVIDAASAIVGRTRLAEYVLISLSGLKPLLGLQPHLACSRC